MVKVWIVSEFLNNLFKSHRDTLDTDRADNNILYVSAVEYLKAAPLNKLIVVQTCSDRDCWCYSCVGWWQSGCTQN